jgi:uncharacterized metal-binding protein YceD (DUF177 family)
MTINSLIIPIGSLWRAGKGTTEKFDLDVPLHLEDIKTVSNLTGKLILIKLKEEISAIVQEASVKLKGKCSKCLKDFTRTIEIPETSREFLMRPPSKDSDPNDVYLIDLRKMEIDLNEMIRQEIILHFPLFPVCSKSCRGLCPFCGKDLNKNVCKCRKNIDTEENKPFRDLKKILKK